jgi:hypothetical protein
MPNKLLLLLLPSIIQKHNKLADQELPHHPLPSFLHSGNSSQQLAIAKTKRRRLHLAREETGNGLEPEGVVGLLAPFPGQAETNRSHLTLFWAVPIRPDWAWSVLFGLALLCYCWWSGHGRWMMPGVSHMRWIRIPFHVFVSFILTLLPTGQPRTDFSPASLTARAMTV